MTPKNTKKGQKNTKNAIFFQDARNFFFKIAQNGLDICILKDFGLNWRVAEILGQIGFWGSVRNIQPEAWDVLFITLDRLK